MSRSRTARVRSELDADPFDRLIVSQASLQEAPLVTKDGDIHEHYRGALWAETPAG